MARIAGVDIPNNKRVEIALTYIYGIGRKSANDILAATGINPDTRAKDLTEDEIAYAASVLPHFRSIINNGVAQACAKDGFLRRSLTTYKGYLTHEETSAIQGRPWVRPEDILEIADQKLDLAPSATKSHSDNFIKLEK